MHIPALLEQKIIVNYKICDKMFIIDCAEAEFNVSSYINYVVKNNEKSHFGGGLYDYQS